MNIRSYNRSVTALRPITLERNYTMHAAGSVLTAFGNTKVLCTASIEDKVPPWLRESGRGWVTAEYGMLPGSGNQRIPRDAAKKGRALEISRLIGRSLRAVVDLEALGPIQITLDCDVLQADGGTRTAAITGAYVALHDALDRVYQDGRIPKIPLTGACAAVSVGVVGETVLLDLDYSEDSQAEVDMNLVMDNQGRYIEVQGSAEGVPFPRETMNAMLDAGTQGIGTLLEAQRKVLGIDE